MRESFAGGAGLSSTPDHCGHEQAVVTGLRQTDDLLPTVDLILAGIRDSLVILAGGGIPSLVVKTERGA